MSVRKENWLNKIAVASLKANKTRNVMIILSAAMICTVIATTLNAAISVVVSAEKSFTDQLGTTAQCSLSHPDEKQLEKLKSLSYIKDFGCEIDAGEASSSGSTMRLLYIDNDEWLNHIKPTITEFHGSMPKSRNDIVMSKTMLNTLGVQKPYLGKSVTFTSNTEERQATQAGISSEAGVDETFIISGWYLDTRQFDLKSMGIAYVSGDFAAAREKNLQNSGDVFFSFQKNAFIKEIGIMNSIFKGPQIELPSGRKLQKVQSDLELKEGQEIDTVRRTFGSIYNAQSLTPYILIIIPALLCGLLLIFDSFYLTMFKDLRECGLLMAVGASLKQMNSILIRQGVLLGGIGILISLPLSMLASQWIVPLYLEDIVGQKGSIVWTFSSFFIAAGIGFFTVMISSQVVNIYMGRVSILQSIRGGGSVKNKSLPEKVFIRIRCMLPKRTKRPARIGVLKLAAINSARNIRLNLHVMFSLFVAACVFLLVGAVVSGINPEAFAVDKLRGHDFILGNKSCYWDYRDPIFPAGVCLQQEVFDSAVIPDIAKQDGVKTVDTIGFLPIAIRTNEALKLYDSGYEEELSQLAGLWFVKPESLQGFIPKEELRRIDMDQFNRGDTVLMNLEPGFFPENLDLRSYLLTEAQVRYVNASTPVTEDQTGDIVAIKALAGRNLRLLFAEGEMHPVPLGVGGYFTGTMDDNLASVGQLPGIYASGALERKLGAAPITAEIMVDVKKEQLENVERYLTDRIGGNPQIDFLSEARLIRTMEATQSAARILGYMLASIVTLIGILAFVSMSLINLRIRRGEFAVLRSIGMSKNQLYRMLAAEGVLYSLVISFLLATVGNLLIRSLYRVFGYGVYHTPVFIFALVGIAIALLLVLIPIITYASDHRKSISCALQEIE